MKLIPVGDSFAMVDDEDFPLLSRRPWHMHEGYAYGHVGGKTIAMHRFIMTPKIAYRIDHFDRNKLNNQKENLRYVTAKQNAANSTAWRSGSGHRGVSRCTTTGMWIARIRANGEMVQVGRFDNLDVARIVYCLKSVELMGAHSPYLHQVPALLREAAAIGCEAFSQKRSTNVRLPAALLDMFAAFCGEKGIDFLSIRPVSMQPVAVTVRTP